ncbi:type 2 lanthipeptide synthetase LanM [bacterium]|nr:type 2 lanthipeptide synthetase LanM [bacterium]
MPKLISTNTEVPFHEIFSALTEDSVKSLQEQLANEKNQLAFSDTIWEDIRQIICRHLSEVSIYVIWHEFNIIRPTEYFNELISQTHVNSSKDPTKYPSTRYKEFTRRNNLISGSGFWKNYPKLIKKILARNDFLKENIYGLLIHANNSLNKIQCSLKIEGTFLLSGITKLDSDSHWQGRGVYLLEFSEIDWQKTHRIIYKQRSVAPEKIFYDIVRKMNETLPKELYLRPLWTIDKDTHGYMEFVEYGICESSESEITFYNKCGTLLSILYCLGITDCHFENIICDGVYPCLIDCETILEPAQSTGTKTSSGYSPFTVISTGFLNCLVTSNTDEEVNIDLSAINVDPRFEDDEKISWMNLGSDLIAVSTEPAPQTIKKCLPNETCFKDRSRINNVQHIKEGFSLGYRSIMSTSLQIIGIVSLAKSLRCRSIFRPTYIYSAIIKNLLQPGILEDEARLHQLIFRLDAASDILSSCQIIIQEEKKQLLDLDIPYFKLNPFGEINQNDPVDISLNLLNDISGYRSFFDRISAMSNLDMNFQLKLINASLLPDFPSNKFLRDGADRSTLPDYLADIMNHVWSTKSIDIFGKNTWVVFTSESIPFESYPGRTGLSLYDGILGICAVTARYISSIEKNNKLAEHYRSKLKSTLPSTLDSIKDLLSKELAVPHQQIGMSGIAGIYIALMSILRHHLSRSIDKLINSVIDLIENYIESFTNNTGTAAPPVDFLNGVTGIINCIAIYPHRFTEKCFGNGIRIIGSLIEEENISLAKKISLNESAEELLKSINLSHGLGGMLLIFAKLLSQKHVDDYKYNLLYIQSSTLYAKAFDDILRENSDDSKAWRIPLQWCNGLSGMLLVFARNQRLFPQTSRPYSIDAAINVVENSLQDLNKGTNTLHLCCGLSGIILSLSLCADYGLNVDTDLLRSSFTNLISESNENRFDLMVPGISSTYQPSLFTGMLGIVLAGIEMNSSKDLTENILC